MNINPIETEYKGYKFRSRLEARWAVFFDAIGAKWQYEPEGFDLADGTRYLPDFLLHGVRGRGQKDGDIYVEIKGVMTPDDLHKIEMFGGYDDKGERQVGVIVFGQIPDAEWVEGDGRKCKPHWRFDYEKDNDETFYNLEYSEWDYYWTEPKAGKGGGLVLDYPDDPYDYVDDNLTEAAFRMARQARFEHGDRVSRLKSNARIIAEETLLHIEKNDQSIAELSEEEKTKMASRCRSVIRAEALKERKSLLMAVVACGNAKERKDALEELIKIEKECKEEYV